VSSPCRIWYLCWNLTNNKAMEQTEAFTPAASYLAFWAAFVPSFGTMARTKLHEQARRCIERLITDRALKPGSQLPTETNLASELYVSRTTIRNALKVLEQEGKIERTPGRGTTVGAVPSRFETVPT
jgi:hypothetical protein